MDNAISIFWLTIAKGIEALWMKVVVAVMAKGGILLLIAVAVGRAETNSHMSISFK